jgi:phage tail protein X
MIQRSANGRATYTTIDGDMLDQICFRFYGYESGSTELVLAGNPGLAALGPVYDLGVEIYLPDLPKAQPKKKRISLFD